MRDPSRAEVFGPTTAWLLDSNTYKVAYTDSYFDDQVTYAQVDGVFMISSGVAAAKIASITGPHPPVVASQEDYDEIIYVDHGHVDAEYVPDGVDVNVWQVTKDTNNKTPSFSPDFRYALYVQKNVVKRFDAGTIKVSSVITNAQSPSWG